MLGKIIDYGLEFFTTKNGNELIMELCKCTDFTLSLLYAPGTCDLSKNFGQSVYIFFYIQISK